MVTNGFFSPQPAMIGTSAEEIRYTKMMLADELAEKVPVDVTSAGINYKEKLRQRQQQKQQSQQQQQHNEDKTQTPPYVQTAAQTATPSVAARAAVTQPAAPTVTSAPATTASPSKQNLETLTSPTKPVVESASSSTPPPPLRVSTPPPAAAPASGVSSSDNNNNDDMRGDVRTLMGMLLKHRGGPGFGAGRLKEPEMERFERLLAQVTSKLREEAGGNVQPPTTPQSAVNNAATTSASPPIFKQQPLAPPPKPQPVVSTSSSITMAETIPGGERVQRMISCIEGAIQMYKNSPPELQEGLLVTMRAALMTAVTTCNRVIAENEQRNYETYQALAGPPSAPSRAAPPSQFYDVIQVQGDDDDDEGGSRIEQPVARAPSANTELDGNSKILEQIYQELKAAAGNGKLGLRPDLTAEEAANLSNSLLDMRAILMEELDAGIPAADEPTSIGTAFSSNASLDQGANSNSKYQQLLAKARASKGGQK
jgi:hypothetical protein